MTFPRHVAVIDIGKTNAKVALVNLETRSEIALRRTPNAVVASGLYPHYDIENLWAFILDSLAALNRETHIDAISVTTHGATAALLDEAGDLALPVLDYEHGGPDQLRLQYEALRPAFEESGAPPLPIGLNLGAQIYWQQQMFPADFARVASIVMYPQYWAHRLCGVLASEVTSLGCHTDLWAPMARDFSSMVDRLGWRRLFPPVRPADALLGPIIPEVASRTGLSAETPVYCGIHDSNASLLPHLLARNQPFCVVSTGTWVICMAVGSPPKPLDPERDTLVNVDAFGHPVPSARFMGGREYQSLTDGLPPSKAADVEAVLRDRILLLPSVVQD
jgi:sugar (pentulose or hexulose) kinase